MDGGVEMTEPKHWKPGHADEVWKVLISARDANQADELLGRLVGILTYAGSDIDKGLDEIRTMSGRAIIEAIVAYRDSSYDSVKSALSK
jgi:hypothetical protein